jgi:hypothetical protein
MTDGKSLIDEAREARTLSPEVRTARQARADRAARLRRQMERARAEGEHNGSIGEQDE